MAPDRKLTDDEKDLLTECLKINYQHIKKPLNYKQATGWDFKFWSTQPVKFSDKDLIHTKNIDSNLSPVAVNLPKSLYFDELTVNLNNMTEISEFLKNNYVEDATSNFRLQYTPEFLTWNLNTKNSVVLVLRRQSNKQMMGLITAVTKTCQISTNKVELAETNYLCVDKLLRNTGLAVLLINELRNRMLAKNIKTGFFTSERYVPTPFSRVQYYHRPLNYMKLYTTKFTGLEDNKLLTKAIRKYTLDQTKKIPDNVVLLEEKYLEQTYQKYNDYMERYTFHDVYTLEEFKDHFMNNNFIHTYVILDTSNNVQDMLAYYTLDSAVLDTNSEYKTIKGAYCYMYTATQNTSRRLLDLMAYLAHKQNHDVLNVTNFLENDDLLDDPNGFYMCGTGFLHYNLYNYECPVMQQYQIGKTIF